MHYEQKNNDYNTKNCNYQRSQKEAIFIIDHIIIHFIAYNEAVDQT
jgi:hypothetical protein